LAIVVGSICANTLCRFAGAPKFPQPLHDAGGLTDSLSPKGGPILSLGAILPLGRLRPFLQDEVRHEI